MRKIILITATAISLLGGSVILGGDAHAAMRIDGFQNRLPIAGVEQIQFLVRSYRGRRYCWYIEGWRGPGWYRCGYALRRGSGWGGGDGWQGWGQPGPSMQMRAPARGQAPREMRGPAPIRAPGGAITPPVATGDMAPRGRTGGGIRGPAVHAVPQAPFIGGSSQAPRPMPETPRARVQSAPPAAQVAPEHGSGNAAPGGRERGNKPPE